MKTNYAKLINHGGELTVNVSCHPATWRKLWREVEENGITMHASKYCSVRRSFGVYVVTGPRDVMQYLWRTTFSGYADSWAAAAREEKIYS